MEEEKGLGKVKKEKTPTLQTTCGEVEYVTILLIRKSLDITGIRELLSPVFKPSSNGEGKENSYTLFTQLYPSASTNSRTLENSYWFSPERSRSD